MKEMQVTIKGSNVNTTAQAMRAALSGATACAKLRDFEHMTRFMELLQWASDEYANAIMKEAADE